MTPTDPTPDSDHHARRKRSREELESLAQSFVAAPVETGLRAPLSRKQLMIAGGIGGALLLVLLVVLVWPSGESEDAARQNAQAERAAQEAAQWKQRFEAERERKRKELQGGKEYLERIAAADAALLKDMQDRAGQLAARAAAAPAPAPAAGPRGAPSQEPTPRDESKSGSKAPAAAPTPAQPSTQTAQAKSQPAPEPAKPAPTPAPSQPQVASAAPATAEAKPVECTIRVSELSSSGKLTYEDIKRMKGARFDEKTGHVFTPRVKTGNGQSVIFEVLPTGCVQVVRSSLGG